MDTDAKITYSWKNRGFVVVWFVVLLPVVLLFAAMAMDFSYMYVAKGQLQNAADAAALAGAAILTEGTDATYQDAARAEAVKFAGSNKAAKLSVTIASTSAAKIFSSTNDIRFGYWKPDGTFDEESTTINAIQVRARRTADSPRQQVPIVFGKYFGWDKMSAVAYATASIPARATGPILMCFQFCEPGTTYPSFKHYSTTTSPPLVLDSTQSGTPKCNDAEPVACTKKFAWTSYYDNVSSSSGIEGLVCNQTATNLPVCGSSIYATMGNDVPPLRALEAQMYNPYFDSGNKDTVNIDGTDTTGWWLIVPITKLCPPGKQGGGDPKEISRYAKIHILYIYSSGGGGGSIDPPCLDYSAPASVRTKIQNKYGITIPTNSIVIDQVSCVDCSSNSFFPGLKPVLVYVKDDQYN